MDSNDASLRDTLSLIEETRLPHPLGPLLSSFVTEAMNPPLAARYISDRLLAGEGTSVASEWLYILESVTQNGCSPPAPDTATRQAIMRRDGGKCCISGKAANFRDPLVVSPILPVPSGWVSDEHQDRVASMFGAFLGAPYRDWWMSYARHPENMSPYHNHWLFQLKLVPVEPVGQLDADGVYPLLADHSRLGIPKIEPCFIGTHARLSPSIRHLQISKSFGPKGFQVSSNSPSETLPPAPNFKVVQSKRSAISRMPRRILLSIWLMVPSSLRIAAYEVLQRLGQRRYGSCEESGSVQILPFGLYMKSHVLFDHEAVDDELRNEFNALQMVLRHSTVPVPEPLDMVSSSSRSYLLTTRVPGSPLSNYRYILPDGGYKQIAVQMRDYLAQLRRTPKTVNPEMAICNTLGEPCREPRIRWARPIGPFANEAAFNQMLRFSDDPARHGHQVFFTLQISTPGTS
ncbi:Uu.00g089370.m01.CDS01 [Anthostomella pinea]|uniref:Uu.00g089370.m01.CDS01 n=1 Tax=Anthostomella pinea TaxID=933095 RepID=A0AAI8VNL9_9PEZI|nr:Uu.00g089370.m01.CDS01 [Anthostomella pinea]